MTIEKRQHIRFSLDIPAICCLKHGEKFETSINQVSIGGCLMEVEENIYVGDDFRLEIQLPNNNWLPLHGKVLYKIEDTGMGVKFVNITKFEQELIAKIISSNLEKFGLPLQVNPFETPPKFKTQSELRINDRRREREEMIQKIMSSEN